MKIKKKKKKKKKKEIDQARVVPYKKIMPLD